jgi:hypothetical protein
MRGSREIKVSHRFSSVARPRDSRDDPRSDLSQSFAARHLTAKRIDIATTERVADNYVTHPRWEFQRRIPSNMLHLIACTWSVLETA